MSRSSRSGQDPFRGRVHVQALKGPEHERVQVNAFITFKWLNVKPLRSGWSWRCTVNRDAYMAYTHEQEAA